MCQTLPFLIYPTSPSDETNKNEPEHVKTNKMTVRPTKTQISQGICPVWSVFTVRMKKAWVLSYPLSSQWRLWSDWADAQADLSLCWAHRWSCWFCLEAAQMSLHYYLVQHFWSVCPIVFCLFSGLFNIKQLPRLNSLVCHMPDSLDLAFKLRRKKFTIEVLCIWLFFCCIVLLSCLFQ